MICYVPGVMSLRSSWSRAEYQDRIEPAERKGVRHGMSHVHPAADIGDVIKIALRIGLGEADGWGDKSILDGLDAGNSFNAAARAKKVAVHGLGRGYGELIGGVAEYCFDSPRLVDVVERGRSSVRIEIVDIGRAEL